MRGLRRFDEKCTRSGDIDRYVDVLTGQILSHRAQLLNSFSAQGIEVVPGRRHAKATNGGGRKYCGSQSQTATAGHRLLSGPASSRVGRLGCINADHNAFGPCGWGLVCHVPQHPASGRMGP